MQKEDRMAIKKITNDEIKNNSIERLSNRPTAAGRIGVGGLSPAELKAAYDKLPMLAIAKINELIDLINAETSSDGIAAFISTPITDPDNDEVKLTLHDVLTDVLNGDFAKYLVLTGLKESTLEEELRHIEEKAISAYEIAVKNGFEGTAEEWLDSLKGKDGKNAVYIGEGDLPADYDMQLIPVGGAHAVIGKRWLLYITEDGKLDVIDLDSVINIDVSDDIEAALAAAKASGEFDGKSVSIVSKTESNEDGGDNIMFFSNGMTLVVKNGKRGKTAYESAQDGGFAGTESEWLASLEGEKGKSAYEYAKEGGFKGTEKEFAEKISREIPTKLSQLENDLGDIGPVEENDPTVPEWAKQQTKPAYTKSEIGLGNVDNVRQYSTSNPPPYPVTSVNGKTGAVTLDHTSVGADKSGTAATEVRSHDANTSAHNDIRLVLQGLSDRLNAVLDSDDATLDEWHEVVAYIKNNKSLIDGITTSKVNVADIVNDLTTNVTNKPLSAAQGVALKALIDALDKDKLDAASLSSAINTALAQAKASGEFDGKSVNITGITESNTSTTINFSDGNSVTIPKPSDGVGISDIAHTGTDGLVDTYTITYTNRQTTTFTVTNGANGERGAGVLRVTTALSSYTTAVGGFTPKYRIALSTVLSESGASEVRVGDTILRNYYTYLVGHVDSSYVYVGAYASIRGSAGTSVTVSTVTESEVSGGINTVEFSDGKTLNVKNGKDGPKGDPYTLTDADKNTIVNAVIAALPKYDGGVS
jgi:hypothetical protein